MQPDDEVRLTLPLERRFLHLARGTATDVARAAGLDAAATAAAERAVEAVWAGGHGGTVTLSYRVGPAGLLVESEVSP